MNPRQPSTAWTYEDLTIWGEIVLRRSARVGVDVTDDISLNLICQDRRDADNMLNWMSWRKRSAYGAALLISEILEATCK